MTLLERFIVGPNRSVEQDLEQAVDRVVTPLEHFVVNPRRLLPDGSRKPHLCSRILQ